MPAQSLHTSIQTALAGFDPQQFRASNLAILHALGYSSDKTREIPGSDPEVFQEIAESYSHQKLNTEKAKFADWNKAEILFQLTDEELSISVPLTKGGQGELIFPDAKIEKGLLQSYLFFAIELSGNRYSRTDLANITRQINRLFPMPAIVFFTYKNELSIAVIHRRQHKRAPDRDVLGQVSLIREINIRRPHRAHLDILQELALENLLNWTKVNNRQQNFDGLMEALLNALDTEELNKRFYRDLFGWFNRAVNEATFPAGQVRTLSPEEHVIRLITRLLFIWFIKEKGLVAGELFIEEQIRGLLHNYDPDAGDSYYRAVLQNLFFATLNTEMGKRSFSQVKNATHRDFSHYRYRKEMSKPDALLGLFRQTPFINGGLFDCLDSEAATREGGWRIDCFSDNENHGKKLLSIPNRLFFDADGLIPLFNRYKFTVEENTPAEQEVALDPELLGKVFENLLAAYNPETRDTARKQTGSYYTPRAVVDYMVDEALVAMLTEKCTPTDDDSDFWQDRLRYLMDYADAFDDANELFDGNEAQGIVRAISEMKVLDPAVGSGAFPIGVLHKLTLALQRLDPDNQYWERLQKERAARRAGAAFDTKNQQERDAELQEISKTFEHYRDSDFGRKLYLIQNSIFGVDIQPVACQIAKLRFFISLAIEQEPDPNADNFGIKPLPNLETRFLSANTLLSLDKPAQLSLGQTDAVIRLEQELNANRERHFHATTRQKKLACLNRDQELRQQLSNQLVQVGWSAGDANKIAKWDPYNQNATADWFNPEYMFGVVDGFDVVVSNPPYINVENLSGEMRSYLFDNYQACEKRTDIYIAFLEKSLSLLNGEGLMCFIIPAAFTKQQYATKMRQTLVLNHTIQELVDASSYRIFENAVVYNIILMVAKGKRNAPTRIRLHHSNSDFDNRSGTEFVIDQNFFNSLKDCRFDTNPLVADALKIKEKIWRNAIRLDRICLVAYGARLNHRSAKIGKSRYISQSPVDDSKRFCEGRNIERYSFFQDGWLNYTPDEHYNPMFTELFESEKLMFIRIVKDRLRFAYDGEGFYNSHTVVNCVRLDLLIRVSHTTAVRAVKNADIALVKQFDYKFLLAVLNSQFTNWYFLNFLSDKLNFYPNDAKELPIPKIPVAEQRPFIQLVEGILSAKASDSEANTDDQEAKIDQLVYGLYGLTEEEIATVEGSV